MFYCVHLYGDVCCFQVRIIIFDDIQRTSLGNGINIVISEQGNELCEFLWLDFKNILRNLRFLSFLQ